MKKLIKKSASYIGSTITNAERMLVLWVGIPLYLIGLGLIMLTLILNNSPLLN
jgi:hypothetical protein